MLVRVSPGRTVHVAAGLAAGEAVLAVMAAADSLSRVAWVILAMLVFAWAGRPGPDGPAAAVTSRMMLQASTKHADKVHLCTVVLFPSSGVSAGRCRPGAGDGKERN
jgi:hypothetical protein